MNTLSLSDERRKAGTVMGNAVPAWIAEGLALLGLYGLVFALLIVGAAL